MESAPRARLIVVDDEPVVLNLVAGLFQAEVGIETLRCRNGAEAMAAMEHGVDVLLTDKNLPDLGGLELARAARDRYRDVEIIILTGYASLETALAAMELDVFDYIVKPTRDIHEIRRKVQRALEKQRMGRENKRLMADLRDRNLALERALGELKEIQAELIQSEKLAGIGTLASGIAHEISSPLFGVMGLAEAILEEEDVDLVRGYAREIVDYSGTIKDIVVQLSGYSRTASSEYHTTVDLLRALDDAVRLVVRSVSFDPACVIVEAEPELYVNARTSEVQQVFVNLVKNAVEALIERYGHHAPGSPFPGRVHVRAGRTDKVVWATVADNGPGIPDDRINAIFDPFYTTKPPGRGTGLGLNIVWRILTKYRGQVLVESAEGKGATFTVRFPLEDSAATQG